MLMPGGEAARGTPARADSVSNATCWLDHIVSPPTAGATCMSDGVLRRDSYPRHVGMPQARRVGELVLGREHADLRCPASERVRNVCGRQLGRAEARRTRRGRRHRAAGPVKNTRRTGPTCSRSSPRCPASVLAEIDTADLGERAATVGRRVPTSASVMCPRSPDPPREALPTLAIPSRQSPPQPPRDRSQLPVLAGVEVPTGLRPRV